MRRSFSHQLSGNLGFPGSPVGSAPSDDDASCGVSGSPGGVFGTPHGPSFYPNATHERRLVRDVQQNTDNIKSKGNFGAQLWLISDANFFENWHKPEIPAIAPVAIVLRGQPAYTPIIFYGPARDTGGLSNVSYDITVRRPDASVYSQNMGLVGFQNLGPADDKVILLGRNYATITVAEGDPNGLYTVEAVVHDNVGKVDLSLVQHFVVQPQ